MTSEGLNATHPSLLQFHAEVPDKGRQQATPQPLEYSPWADSLASPASSRDFDSPALLTELDFSTAQQQQQQDSLFSNGTQSQQHADWLAEVDLFADDYNSVINNAFSVAAQQQQQQHESAERITAAHVQQLFAQHQEAHPAPQPATPPRAVATNDQNMGVAQSNALLQDFSFDGTLAMSLAAAPKEQQSANTHGALLTVASASRGVSRSSSAASLFSTQSSSQESFTSQDSSINQLAAVFVREYARTHEVRDIHVLIRALKVSGIDVSDHVVQELLARKSPSPAAQTPAAASDDGASQLSSAPSSTVERAHHAHGAPMYANYWTPGHTRAHYAAADNTMPTSSSSPISEQEQTSRSVSPIAAAASSPVAAPVSKKAVAQAPKARSSSGSKAKESLLGTGDLQTVGSGANKRFVCPSCSKTFDRAFNLRTHATTHMDPEERARPFVCPWQACDKDFARKHDALRHYKSVHARRGELVSEEVIRRATAGVATVVAT